MAMEASIMGQRFVRRTSLNLNEYRTNFRQIDCDVIATLVSEEASKITHHMSKIYLALITAPSEFWEREGVLRLIGREREGNWQTAWEQLIELVGVASATARKALSWMGQQGVIGYFAGRNGVGIRIFINRAASSIGRKSDQGQKNLRLIPTSSDAPPTSTDEVSFKGTFILEDLDLNLNPRAPKNGATDTSTNEKSPDPNTSLPVLSTDPPRPMPFNSTEKHFVDLIDGAAIAERIVRQVIPQVKAATAHEHECTRKWFINHALPKAVRVAQSSAYDVLRNYGLINERRSRNGTGRNYQDDRKVGKNISAQTIPRLLSDEEISELAGSCVALLVTQGQAISLSLSEMSVEVGGFLLPEDAQKICARAEVLLRAGEVNRNSRREGNDG